MLISFRLPLPLPKGYTACVDSSGIGMPQPERGVSEIPPEMRPLPSVTTENESGL